mmetsp:Transcript_12729/g.20220  ORF Transcript_12729/g.20220 Transcript_12729/m.20220 type:complete len:145 (+) Transcript_12729:122-556(+)
MRQCHDTGWHQTRCPQSGWHQRVWHETERVWHQTMLPDGLQASKSTNSASPSSSASLTSNESGVSSSDSLTIPSSSPTVCLCVCLSKTQRKEKLTCVRGQCKVAWCVWQEQEVETRGRDKSGTQEGQTRAASKSSTQHDAHTRG